MDNETQAFLDRYAATTAFCRATYDGAPFPAAPPNNHCIWTVHRSFVGGPDYGFWEENDAHLRERIKEALGE